MTAQEDIPYTERLKALEAAQAQPWQFAQSEILEASVCISQAHNACLDERTLYPLPGLGELSEAIGKNRYPLYRLRKDLMALEVRPYPLLDFYREILTGHTDAVSVQSLRYLDGLQQEIVEAHCKAAKAIIQSTRDNLQTLLESETAPKEKVTYLMAEAFDHMDKAVELLDKNLSQSRTH